MLMDFHPFSPKAILTSPHPAVTGNHLDEPSANHTRQQSDIAGIPKSQRGNQPIPCEKAMLENQQTVMTSAHFASSLYSKGPLKHETA